MRKMSLKILKSYFFLIFAGRIGPSRGPCVETAALGHIFKDIAGYYRDGKTTTEYKYVQSLTDLTGLPYGL